MTQSGAGKLTHNELASSLAEWLRNRSLDRRRMTWENLEFCDNRPDEPYIKCRPDVFSMRPVLDVARSQPWSHEVKISRTDFQSDVRSGKWMNYRRFSCRVFFACPNGLILPNELPEGAGLWWLTDGNWEEIKSASFCKGWEIGPREMMKLIMGRWGTTPEMAYPQHVNRPSPNQFPAGRAALAAHGGRDGR